MAETLPYHVRATTGADAGWVEALTRDAWGGPTVVVHGTVYTPHDLPGFLAVADRAPVGLVTIHIQGESCEIVTLNSLRGNMGVGTALVEAVRRRASAEGRRRLWLITTNDNLGALRFYQKRGFRMVAVHRGAVERSRAIKPSIPLLGDYGIPIRDEIELELIL